MEWQNESLYWTIQIDFPELQPDCGSVWEIGEITVQAQSVFQGDTPELRGIRLDVEITEKIENSREEGESASCRIYDVEAQNREVTDLPGRSRFYQAKLDSKGLESGEKNWSSLPDLYVIMISNFDPRRQQGNKDFTFLFTA